MDISKSAAFLREVRRAGGLTQRDLAERAGTSQPAIARIENGLASPTLSTLERLVAAAGYDVKLNLIPRSPADPVVERYKRDVDRTLLRENLKKTVDQRLLALVELQEAAAEVRRAGRRRP
jgi:transcriptional regulator with XRE-family HTH domain